jgi:cyanate permease
VTSMTAIPLASDIAEIDSWPKALVYIAFIAAVCFVMWVLFRD